MKNKKNLKVVLPVLLVSSSAFVLFQIKGNSLKVPAQNYDSSTNPDTHKSSDQIVTPTGFQKLIILPERCRGCGRCVRIDSSHFEMVGNIAHVISSTNLSSQNLSMAISSCPGQAIALK